MPEQLVLPGLPEAPMPPMTRREEIEFARCIEDIVSCFCRPIIVANAWGESVPPWMVEAARIERLLNQMKGVDDATDADVAIYLYTASMEAPLTHDGAQVYLYLTTKLCRDHGKDVPEDIAVEKLTDDQERFLKELRYDVHRNQTRAFKAKRMAA